MEIVDSVGSKPVAFSGASYLRRRTGPIRSRAREPTEKVFSAGQVHS